MTDLDNISYFLRIEFYKCGRRFFMRQRRYDIEILKRFEMEHCNYASTRTKPRLQLTNDSYISIIGSLRYLCHTRVGLAYSVGMASRFMQKPNIVKPYNH